MTASSTPKHVRPEIGDHRQGDAFDPIGRVDVSARPRRVRFRKRLYPLRRIGSSGCADGLQQLIARAGRFVGIIDEAMADQRPQHGLCRGEVDLQVGDDAVTLFLGSWFAGHDGDIPPSSVDGWLTGECVR